jgi:hypothetical protein
VTLALFPPSHASQMNVREASSGDRSGARSAIRPLRASQSVGDQWFVWAFGS